MLLWKKGDDFVAVGDRIVNPSDARLQLVKETNGNTLVISLAEEVDAGDYVCKVSTNKPIEIKHSVKIGVNARPRWTNEPTDKQFPQGSNAKIDCKADGFPQPKISWKKAVGKKFYFLFFIFFY